MTETVRKEAQNLQTSDLPYHLLVMMTSSLPFSVPVYIHTTGALSKTPKCLESRYTGLITCRRP
jgi:hypothetical protein